MDQDIQPDSEKAEENTEKNYSSEYSRVTPVIEIGLIVLGLVGMLLVLPHSIYSDGEYRFQAISALLGQGKLLSDPLVTRYSLIGPLFSAPFWYLGKVYATTRWWCERYNLFIFAIGMLVTYWLLKDRIDRSLLRRFFLVLIAASMFAVHTTTYYGEVFTAVCVGFGILALLIRFSVPAGWVAIILGVANTPASIVGLGLVILKYILDSKRFRYVLIGGAAIAVIGIEAWIRRGSPLTTGYADNAGYRTIMPYSGLPGFSYPFFFGMLSILLSFGKGLIFFAPGLLLPVRKILLKMQQEKKLEVYRVYVLWMCFLLGLILVYARWWAWYGGMFWGPRFFLFASIPASFALAVRLRHHKEGSLAINLLTLLAFALSTWVGIDGALYGERVVQLSACIANNYALEALCHYTPEFSVLWQPFVVHYSLSLSQKLYAFYCACVFLYLAFPLIVRTAQQVIELVRPFLSANLDLKLWRF